MIEEAIAAAEERDLSKDSCTSGADVISIVNKLRREEQNQLGRNPHASLHVFSRSTLARIVKKVTPNTMKTVRFRIRADIELCEMQEMRLLALPLG